MTSHKCEYRIECNKYDKDAICCTFLYKICIYNKHYARMNELTKFNVSPTGIEGCLSDAELFELSQENKGVSWEDSLK